MNMSTTLNAKKWSQSELIAQLDYALELALELHQQLDNLDASLEEAHQVPMVA